jgi:hypothetical protein
MTDDPYADEDGKLDDVITQKTPSTLQKFVESWRARHVTIEAVKKGFSNPMQARYECPPEWKDKADIYARGCEAGYALRIGVIVLFFAIVGEATFVQLVGVGV